MVRHAFTTFSQPNRRTIFLLIAGHLLWSGMLFGIWQPLLDTVKLGLLLLVATLIGAVLARWVSEQDNKGDLHAIWLAQSGP